jgi:hypothetical protein
MKVRQLILAVVIGALTVVVATVPAADAGKGQAPEIFPHRHFLVTPDGMVPVGPQVCESPWLQSAFNQFHAAVHVGPANTAFDHDHNPVDIVPGAC